MYHRQRVDNCDPRFRQDALYMGHAVSTFQHQQLNGCVNVMLRQTRGAAITHGNLRQLAAQEAAGEELPDAANTAYAFMRNIRGTAAYWQNARSDLFALLGTAGPPTWFMTLSANDAWDDLALFLGGMGDADEAAQAAFLAGLSNEQRSLLVANNQVDAAVHFQHRFEVFLRYLTAENGPLGNVTDWWWRVEFQARGSPHVHMMLWVDGAPDVSTAAGLQAAPAYVDRYVSTCIAPDSETDPQQHLLHQYSSTLQQHSHRPTCYKHGGLHCRFGFPREPCECTRLRQTGDGRARACDVVLTRRCARNL